MHWSSEMLESGVCSTAEERLKTAYALAQRNVLRAMPEWSCCV